jgi:hypothetical protein
VIIVIIVWKIFPGDENERAFLDFWAQLEPGGRSRLAGEYLSRPLSAEEAGLKCSLVGLNPGDDYVPFFNVGIWESLEALREQVYAPFVDSGPDKHAFEYAQRERVILAPQRWRVGTAQLPTEDHLSPN